MTHQACWVLTLYGSNLASEENLSCSTSQLRRQSCVRSWWLITQAVFDAYWVDAYWGGTVKAAGLENPKLASYPLEHPGASMRSRDPEVQRPKTLGRRR